MTEQPPQRAIDCAINEAITSTCLSKRGASIWKSTIGLHKDGIMIFGKGRNHLPCGYTCTADTACKSMCSKTAIHAEQEALIDSRGAAWSGEMLHVKVIDEKLVPSGPPSCWQCSKLMLEAGIKGMWLYHEDGWKRYEMAEFHKLTLINCGLLDNIAEVC